MKIQYKFLAFLLIVLSFSQLIAFENDKLKNYLWQNNFKEMIDRFSEEKITLVEKGREKKRIEARPYKIEKGFRLQLFAGTNKSNATKLASELNNSIKDSIYINEENDIFKVQVGNFRQKIEAEKKLDELRYAGFTNAWIVNTDIHVLKTKSEIPSPPTKTLSEQFIYSIQIFVTNDFNRANYLLNEFSENISEKIWIKSEPAVYKLLVGRFADEHMARNVLQELKSGGYSDAWITQVKSGN